MREALLRTERRPEHPVPHYPVEWYPYQPRSTSPSSLPQPSLKLSSRTVRLVQLSVVLGIGALSALAYALHDGLRSEVGRALAILATGDGVAIGDYLRSYGVGAPVASLFLMLVQAVAAPVPAILVAFANGLAFGVVWGGLLTVVGQTLAAAVCFWISRALGRGPVEALTSSLGLATADRWLTRWGSRGIILLRLVPGISFDVVSYGAGLTGIRFAPFLIATAVGVTPQAFLYAYLIREAPRSAWAFYAASWGVIAIIGLAAIVRVKRPGQRVVLPERRSEPALHASSLFPSGCPTGE
ncbi:MAG: TVP38/TMEM64 family protein [Chloroflexi bacterium]|nr:TVP38/TMEM64 family protein [Chloroflexota bacterium]